MALYKATIKISRTTNGVRLEKGMSVEIASTAGNPIHFNGGKLVAEAFVRVYGVDLAKAHGISSGVIDVVKIN